jgi:hypothetical protein
MEMKSGTIEFPVGTGERTQTMTFLFPRRVIEAHVALSGYQAQYRDDDHHVKRLTVKLFARPGAHVDEGFEAVVTAVFNLRDQNADDPYSGSISFVLFVQTEGILPPIITR